MVKAEVKVIGDPACTHAILSDFSKYLEWYPECEECTHLSTTGTNTDIQMQLGGMKVARMVLRYDFQPNFISYDMVSSSDLKGFKGSYRIIDGGDGTHTVQMEVDLTAGVPKFVTDRMMKGSLAKQGKQFQERNARSAAAPAGAPSALAGSPAAAVGAPAAARTRRPRCLLRVKNTGDGVSIWYGGAEFRKTR